MPDPNQSNPNPQNPLAPSIGPVSTQTPNPMTSMQPDLPPLPPDFQNTPVTPPAAPVPESTAPMATEDNGSAAPNPLMPPMSVTPKKKFGGDRIIATILGLFLLVGGIGAGIVLTQNQQLFQQKAAGLTSPQSIPVPAGKCTTCLNGACVAWDPTKPYPGNSSCQASGKPQCGTGLNCSSLSIGGNTGACNQGNGNNNAVFCCPAGQTIRNNSCSTDTVHCGDGKCETNEGNSSSSVYCAKDCGGSGPKTGPCQTTNSKGQPVTGTWVTSTDGKITVCSPPGNCQTHPGDCYVQNGIGTTIPGGGGDVCDAQGHFTHCADGYVCNNLGQNGGDCVPIKHGGGGGGGGSSGGGDTATCGSVKTYSTNWTLLSPPLVLPPGGKVEFCVSGVTSGGTFDKARFSVNGITLGETTTKRPGSQDFCKEYTVPTSGTQFSVTADIHHATLGWR